ncbi:hypothetical protein J4225_01295 [Candidatus Pacearchaeota archaeon]|nr:hypothetical protein [Candidatus Pacearchaeota archaeon]
MKKDKFYLVVGILELILGVFVFFKNSYILGLVIFFIGVLIIIKDYLNLIRFKG